MRAAVRVIAIAIAFSLIACSRHYTLGIAEEAHGFSPKQIRVVASGLTRDVPGARVHREFFADFGARPYLGRFFAEHEFQANRPAVAVISYKAWHDMFRSRPEVIGSTVQVDGRQTTIIGVAERHFAPSGAGEFWIPNS